MKVACTAVFLCLYILKIDNCVVCSNHNWRTADGLQTYLGNGFLAFVAGQHIAGDRKTSCICSDFVCWLQGTQFHAVRAVLQTGRALWLYFWYSYPFSHIISIFCCVWSSSALFHSFPFPHFRGNGRNMHTRRRDQNSVQLGTQLQSSLWS